MKKDSILTIALTTIIIVLVVFSSDAKNGATNGIALCQSIIIPALLPMLIITGIISRTKSTIIIKQLLGKITSKLFHLPSECTSAIVLGLIAGYPAGTLMTSELVSSFAITKQDARQIMKFNFCGGIAFIITTVGTIELKSTKAGLILFISSIVSSVIIAITTRSKKEPMQDSCIASYLSPSDALVSSVQAATKSIIIMCSYIILCTTLMNILPIPSKLIPFFEITNGTLELFGSALPYYSFFLCFGGICVHLQLLGELKKMDIKYSEFAFFRIVHSLLSFGITKLILTIFPQTVEVFSNTAEHTVSITQVNAGLSIVLILGCIVLVFDIESKKYKLI